MTEQSGFLSAISAEHLYGAAAVFGIATGVMVAIIYTFLYVKKRRYLLQTEITNQLNDWIGDELTREDEDAPLPIPEVTSAHLHKPAIRQFIINSLINTRKNLSGSMRSRITDIYERLGLKADSEEKLAARAWHKKAKGIYELYMMRQEDALPRILRFTNDKNEYVRTEAQTAVIGFTGFAGLSFLHTLTYPLNDWQQIKLLEQLRTAGRPDMPHLQMWLRSRNIYVVHFALKLAEIYKQLQVADDVPECLKYHNDKVRQRAIETLGAIAGPETVALLKRQYAKENTANKKEILRQTGRNGSEEDVDFLTAALAEPEDALKLEAARALVAINEEYLSILAERANHDETIRSIAEQVKYENAL